MTINQLPEVEICPGYKFDGKTPPDRELGSKPYLQVIREALNLYKTQPNAGALTVRELIDHVEIPTMPDDKVVNVDPADRVAAKKDGIRWFANELKEFVGRENLPIHFFIDITLKSKDGVSIITGTIPLLIESQKCPIVVIFGSGHSPENNSSINMVGITLAAAAQRNAGSERAAVVVLNLSGREVTRSIFSSEQLDAHVEKVVKIIELSKNKNHTLNAYSQCRGCANAGYCPAIKNMLGDFAKATGMAKLMPAYTVGTEMNPEQLAIARYWVHVLDVPVMQSIKQKAMEAVQAGKVLSFETPIATYIWKLDERTVPIRTMPQKTEEIWDFASKYMNSDEFRSCCDVNALRFVKLMKKKAVKKMRENGHSGTSESMELEVRKMMRNKGFFPEDEKRPWLVLERKKLA